MQKKRAAMELSVSTIVIIVLAMSMLILGLVLVKNIFGSATGVAELTDAQLRDEIQNLFGRQAKLAIYPNSRHVELKQGEVGGFGIGILNDGDEGSFSYNVVVSNPVDLQRNCNVGADALLSDWVVTGRTEEGIPLGPGQFTSGKVLLDVPETASLCTFRLRVNALRETAPHASEFVDVTIVS